MKEKEKIWVSLAEVYVTIDVRLGAGRPIGTEMPEGLQPPL